MAICTQLVWPIHKRKKPVVLHLLQLKGSLHQCGAHLCTMHSSLLLCMLFFNFRDANNDNLASSPTSASSTICSHGLVQTWWSVRYNRHAFLVWSHQSWTQSWLLPHLIYTMPEYKGTVYLGTVPDWGTDGALGTARLCSHSLNEMDFAGALPSALLISMYHNKTAFISQIECFLWGQSEIFGTQRQALTRWQTIFKLT